MNAKATHHEQQPRLPDPRAEYVEAFERRARAALRSSCGRWDLDDVVQSECERLWRRLDDIMEKFPKAEVYATMRARSGQAVTDYLRKQSAQAGTGAVKQYDDQHRLVKGREVVNGDGRYHDPKWDHYDDRPGGHAKGRTYFDAYARAHADEAEQLLDRLAGNEMLRAALLGLSATEREVLLLVDGLGYTVTEAAARLGIRRETAARKRSAAYKAINGQAPC